VLGAGRGQVWVSRCRVGDGCWMARLDGHPAQRLGTSILEMTCEGTVIGDIQVSALLLLCCPVLSLTFFQALSSLAMQIHTPNPLISSP